LLGLSNNREGEGEELLGVRRCFLAGGRVGEERPVTLPPPPRGGGGRVTQDGGVGKSCLQVGGLGVAIAERFVVVVASAVVHSVAARV
jgi:hypothetical protein